MKIVDTKEEFGNLNPDYIGRYTMIQSLRYQNMDEGIQKALYFIKICLKAEDVILYQEDEQKNYIHSAHQVMMKNRITFITETLNKAKKLIEKNEYIELTIDNSKLSNLMFLYLELPNSKYILAIKNYKTELTEDLINVLKESLTVVLQNYESYKLVSKQSMIDELTGLYNRKAYNQKLAEIDSNQRIYNMLFCDLFQLKTVNDQFNHQVGDIYIKETAYILKKYFPEYEIFIDDKGIQHNIPTGNTIYRTGGDEYVVISDTVDMQDMKIRIELARQEVEMIDLGVNQEVIRNLNYGVAERKANMTANETLIKAEELLSIHKRDMYNKLGINRRNSKQVVK